MWGARGGRDIWCAWKRRGAEGGLAAGELRLLLPGRHTAKFEAICGCAPNPDTNPIGCWCEG